MGRFKHRSSYRVARDQRIHSRLHCADCCVYHITAFSLLRSWNYSCSCPDRALDTHIYQAWRDPDSRIGFYNDACGVKGLLAEIEREFGPVIVGEWSLATDNCAMWLNGFNDNLPGFPRLPCKYVKCSEPYMGDDVQPGAPVDPTKANQGPYGTGMSGPIYGLCPVVGSAWFGLFVTCFALSP